jgi:hypothetical protein
MRRLLLSYASILLFVSCAHWQPTGSATSATTNHRSGAVATAAVTKTLLDLSQQWVDTWNERDVERMAAMHGDVTQTRYAIGQTSTTVEWLLQEIRATNYWNVSWKIRMVEPHVRVLNDDAGFVFFRLVGDETIAGATRPFSAAFTLVYQKLDGEWKIVHVQDSSRLEAQAP